MSSVGEFLEKMKTKQIEIIEEFMKMKSNVIIYKDDAYWVRNDGKNRKLTSNRETCKKIHHEINPCSRSFALIRGGKSEIFTVMSDSSPVWLACSAKLGLRAPAQIPRQTM
jgi:hypothetical protein